MAGGYEKAITIQKAIANIVERRYLLPAIQRKFEWDIDRICVLFDSIMRGYPINTFMFWEVTDSDIKKNFKFYQFLEKYCEWFAEDNPDFSTTGNGNFQAVIDGQQRLTSIYIGLKGTYSYKLPRKRWPKTQDEEIFPPRKLYLNLSEGLVEENNEGLMLYDFKFHTDHELKALSADTFWFLVGDVLNFATAENESDVLDIVMSELEKRGQSANTYARQTLTRLYFKIRRESIIHFYNETSQSIDHVLDIFIRTNHGGKSLSFSDLLMSIAIANWKKDARQQIDSLIKDIWNSPEMGFAISRDWILKTALAITNADIRFKVENFSGDTVALIEKDWDEIKACILETFKFIKLIGLNDESLRAKNAAIPIAYYLYHKGRKNNSKKKALYSEINKLTKHKIDRQRIAQWLMMSLLKGAFSGQGDSILSKLRELINANINKATFPLNEIVEEYRGKSKDIEFDDSFIERTLKTQKDDPKCYMLLALLMPERIFTSILHKDHLHPAAEFSSERLIKRSFLSKNPALKEFYLNSENWNSIVNLHLLDASMNQSKLDTALADWLTQHPTMTPAMLLIDANTPLDFESFPKFIEQRTIQLTTALKNWAKSK